MALTPQEVFRSQLRKRREARGWDQAQLAEEMTKLGFKMDRRIISNIELGLRKDISLNEAFGFAAALNVPPPLLWLLSDEEEKVWVTDRSKIDPHLAFKWFIGDAPLAASNGRAIRAAEWSESAERLHLYRRLDELQERANAASLKIHKAEYIGDASAAQRAREGFADALKAIYRHFEIMRKAGMRHPKLSKELPKEWTEVAKQLGLEGREMR